MPSVCCGWCLAEPSEELSRSPGAEGLASWQRCSGSRTAADPRSVLDYVLAPCADLGSADENGKEKAITKTTTAQGLFPFIKEDPQIWQVRALLSTKPMHASMFPALFSNDVILSCSSHLPAYLSCQRHAQTFMLCYVASCATM